MPSSVISDFHYDEVTATLQIIYVSGMVYDYKNVPQKVYAAMKKATSKGTYLNRYVKGRYQFEKIK